MKQRLKLVAVLVTAVTLFSVLTACGGSDKKSTSAGGSGTTDTASSSKAPTGDPVVIGSIGTYSSATAAVQNDPLVGKKATEAWVKWVNAHGGINGHPLKVIVKDDENDAAKSKAAIQELVEQDHVIAIVNSEDSSFDATWTDYITSKNIPVIGGASYGFNWVKAPFFLSGSDVLTSVFNEPVAAKAAGFTKYATILCSEAAVCAQAIPLHKQGADKAGIPLVYGGVASGTAANYTPQCVELKKAGADIVAIGGPDPVRMKQDCDRQGLDKLAWLLPASAFTVQAAKDLGSALSTVQSFPWFYDGPETKDFHAAMKQYGNIKADDDSMVTSLSWVSGLMFQKAVELSGVTGVPTTADILKGLNSFKGETLGGLSVPLTFGDPRPDGGRFKCYFTAAYKDGKFVAPDGLKTSCLPF